MSEITSTDLVFDDIDPIVVTGISIAGQKYVLKEVPESVLAKWKTDLASHVSLDDNGIPTSAAGMENLKWTLVATCLFMVSERHGQVRVSKDLVETWPSRVIKPLYEKAREINGLDDNHTVREMEDEVARLQRILRIRQGKNGDTAVKNSPGATAGSSV